MEFFFHVFRKKKNLISFCISSLIIKKKRKKKKKGGLWYEEAFSSRMLTKGAWGEVPAPQACRRLLGPIHTSYRQGIHSEAWGLLSQTWRVGHGDVGWVTSGKWELEQS